MKIIVLIDSCFVFNANLYFASFFKIEFAEGGDIIFQRRTKKSVSFSSVFQNVLILISNVLPFILFLKTLY